MYEESNFSRCLSLVMTGAVLGWVATKAWDGLCSRVHALERESWQRVEAEIRARQPDDPENGVTD